MRKYYFLTILLVVTAITAFSQSISLIHNSTVLQQGATIIQPGSHDSSELITFLKVQNTTASRIDVYCKKSELSVMDSTETTMCWAGGCYPNWVTVSPEPQTLQAGEINTDFSGHYVWMGNTLGFRSGETVIRWVFYNASNINDSASVTVYYTSYGTGLGETGLAKANLTNAFPNPANSKVTIGYSVSAEDQGNIVIRDVLGSVKFIQPLESGAGKVTISVAGLTDGIYFYSLEVEGKSVQTRKLMVKH